VKLQKRKSDIKRRKRGRIGAGHKMFQGKDNSWTCPVDERNQQGKRVRIWVRKRVKK